MTRDEAIAAVRAASVLHGNALEGGQFVDRMAALGLLKLDEPKSVDERVWELLEGRHFRMNHGGGNVALSREAVDQIISILAVAGFKIVDS